MARLDHPHIAVALDHGTLDEEAARELGMPDGVPWLAMELASAGTLVDNGARGLGG